MARCCGIQLKIFPNDRARLSLSAQTRKPNTFRCDMTAINTGLSKPARLLTDEQQRSIKKEPVNHIRAEYLDLHFKENGPPRPTAKYLILCQLRFRNVIRFIDIDVVSKGTQIPV